MESRVCRWLRRESYKRTNHTTMPSGVTATRLHKLTAYNPIRNPTTNRAPVIRPNIIVEDINGTSLSTES